MALVLERVTGLGLYLITLGLKRRVMITRLSLMLYLGLGLDLGSMEGSILCLYLIFLGDLALGLKSGVKVIGLGLVLCLGLG